MYSKCVVVGVLLITSLSSMFISMQMFPDLWLILNYNLADTWYLGWYLVTVKPSTRDHPKWEDLVVTYGRWLCVRVDKQPWGLFQEEVLTQLIFGRQLNCFNCFSACNTIIAQWHHFTTTTGIFQFVVFLCK